jgi:CheY-like chemotaxis protein
VVDDKECIRTSMSLVFESLGYSVRSAEDGHSALREIRRQNPDILLSDLAMPGMSGFELLTDVRHFFPEIRVIASSGSFSGSDVPDGVLADAFYPKGSGVSALLQILRSLPQMHSRIPGPIMATPHPDPCSGVLSLDA